MAKNKDKKSKTRLQIILPDVKEEELSENQTLLKKKIKVLSELVKSLEEKTLRAQAEIENVRKTSQKDIKGKNLRLRIISKRTSIANRQPPKSFRAFRSRCS